MEHLSICLRPAVNQPYRHFPIFSSSLNGNNLPTWERLSSVARTINFSLTVRDNNSSFGRVSQANNIVTVSNTGPFAVTAPNGSESLTTSTTVTWTVNGTNTHCASVDILLSMDGGTTFSVMANATPNDGSEVISFPQGSTQQARILVRCDVAGGFRAASTFYDVSDNNFSISSGDGCPDNVTITTATTGNTLASSLITTQGSVEANGAIFSASMINIGNNFSVPSDQCFEVYNDGCSFSGSIDCQNMSQGDGSCNAPFSLTCGMTFQGNTNNGTSTWAGYPAGQDYPSAETIHIITIPANTAGTFVLSSSVDMDLFISTTTCDNNPEYVGNDLGNESVMIPAQNETTTYYLVVDGFGGASGDYTLSCN